MDVFVNCRLCGRGMASWELKDDGICIFCNAKDDADLSDLQVAILELLLSNPGYWESILKVYVYEVFKKL